MLRCLKYALALSLTVVPGLRPIAKAQDLSALPACAKPAVLAAFQASGCKSNDADCLCSNPQLASSLLGFVQDACDPADQAAIVAFGQTYCGAKSSSAATATNSQPVGVPFAGLPVTTPIAGHSITGAYSPTTSMPKPTNETQKGGAMKASLSAAALAAAVGALGWMFGEL